MSERIATYWTLPPSEQGKMREAQAKADLEAYAVENELLIHKGKLVKPENYPCKCELWNAAKCWEEKHPNARDSMQGVCKCPCHTYYED